MDGAAPYRDGTAASRLPPHNSEAEQQVLGAILGDNAVYHRVASFLRPEHFAEAIHARIYSAASSLIERGQVASPITLRRMADADAALDEAAGAQYLARLVRVTELTINAPDYARVIVDLWSRRQIITAAQDAIDRAAGGDPDDTIEAIAEEAQRRIAEAAQAGAGQLEPVTAGESADQAIAAIESAYKAGGRVPGVTTGLADLDRAIGGFRAGDLVVLAGRPSMGKSALAGNMVFAAARSFRDTADRTGAAPKMALLFSLEMRHAQYTQRFLARLTSISTDRQERGDITSAGFDQLLEARETLAALPLILDERGAVGVPYIRARAQRWARRGGVGLIAIDHLQLMRQGGRAEQRRLEIGEITGALKALAKELSCPILLLSQLSRAVESREDKRPMMSDLRESGDIEQDADVVLLLYRAAYYLERDPPEQRSGEDDERFAKRQAGWQRRLDDCRNLADIVVAKQRMGRTATVTAVFNEERQRFDGRAREGML